jgi:hypothetical protein
LCKPCRQNERLGNVALGSSSIFCLGVLHQCFSILLLLLLSLSSPSSKSSGFHQQALDRSTGGRKEGRRERGTEAEAADAVRSRPPEAALVVGEEGFFATAAASRLRLIPPLLPYFLPLFVHLSIYRVILLAAAAAQARRAAMGSAGWLAGCRLEELVAGNIYPPRIEEEERGQQQSRGYCCSLGK